MFVTFGSTAFVTVMNESNYYCSRSRSRSCILSYVTKINPISTLASITSLSCYFLLICHSPPFPHFSFFFRAAITGEELPSGVGESREEVLHWQVQQGLTAYSSWVVTAISGQTRQRNHANMRTRVENRKDSRSIKTRAPFSTSFFRVDLWLLFVFYMSFGRLYLKGTTGSVCLALCILLIFGRCC